MDDEGGLENSLTRLRIRVAHLEWILVAIVGMILAFLMGANVLTAAAISKSADVFADMLAGKPLPTITQWIISYENTGLAGLVAALLPLGTFIFLVLKKQSRASWYIALGVIAFLAFHLFVILSAAWILCQLIVLGF